MRHVYQFVASTGTVTCEVSRGRTIEVPVIPGILKHPTLDSLAALLKKPHVMRKYTLEALQTASWPVLRQFPREWLKELLQDTTMRPSRLRALAFLLS